MNGASEITDKLAKLLRLACCDTAPDGERAAALNRLSAIAAAHDLDWDRVLANGKAPDLTEAQMQRLFEAGFEAGLEVGRLRAAEQQPDWTPTAPPPRSLEYVEKVLAAAAVAERGGQLNEFEETFSSSIRQKIRRYGTRSRISDKQWGCIERLAEGLERAGYLEW